MAVESDQRSPGSEEPEAFRLRVRRWLSETQIPQIPDDAVAAFEARRMWQRRLAEAGLIGVNWPRALGGQGLTMAHQVVAMEELVRADAPSPASVVNLYVIGPTLISHGSADQKKRYVPKLLRAEEIWCQGFSEPNAGSDLSSLQTKAVEDGDHFVVNGQKTWTSQAQFANFCGLLARTDAKAPSHKGITYLIVDMTLPGITVRPIRQISGGSEFNEVFFENVRVPRHSTIGAINGGWQVAVRSLRSERSTIIAQRRSEANAIFSYAVNHFAKRLKRERMEAPPEIALRIGHVRMQLAVLDAQVRALAGRLEAETDIPGQESVDKLVLTEVEQEAFSLALDLLGPGRQVTDGCPDLVDAHRVIHDYFYARSRSISGGTTQIQRNVVAQRLLELPRS